MNNRKYYISDDCVAEKLNEEMIVLNVSTGKYHELDAIGIVIWEEIKSSNPNLNDLIESLRAMFNDSFSETDVKMFLKSLLDRGIILRK